MKPGKFLHESAIGWISTTDSLMLGFGIMLLLALGSASALENIAAQVASDQDAIADAQAATARARALEEKCDALQAQLRGMRQAFEDVKRDRDRLVKINEGQEQATKDVLGFKGKFRRVAFVVDISKSMTTGLGRTAKKGVPATIGQQRWDKTKAEILSWAENLPMEKLHLLFFHSETQPYPERGSYYDMRDGNRQRNVAIIKKRLADIRPNYQTNTPAALREALALPDVDTIILFSDGKPELEGESSPGMTEEVLALARDAKNVPINVVGIGDYYKDKDGALGDFLHSISEITGGEFIGR